MKTLQGKTVFLTGAASGIGRALALQLAETGCHLFLVDKDQDGLKRVAADLPVSEAQRVWLQTCDLSRPQEVDDCVRQFQACSDVIDIVINNAGVAWYGPTERMTLEQWEWLMNINLHAPIRITQQLLPALLQRPESHVVNMCSVAGLVAAGRFAAYQTSKFALIGFSESLRVEYGRKGLGVSAICPGPVVTQLYDSAGSGHEDGHVPTPPRWASATPELVARRTLRAIRKNQRQVLITPLAHVASRAKRFFPGLLDAVSQFSRSRKRKMKERQRKEEQRLAGCRQRRMSSLRQDDRQQDAA